MNIQLDGRRIKKAFGPYRLSLLPYSVITLVIVGCSLAGLFSPHGWLIGCLAIGWFAEAYFARKLRLTLTVSTMALIEAGVNEVTVK